jgi:hypothetical protein
MGLLLLIFPIWSCRTYLHVRYGHKTQASLLSLEFLSKQLEAGLSPIELHFYEMVCLSMWETQTRSQPLSVYWRLIFSVGPMIECSLAPECEWKGTGAPNCPCCLCMAGSPLSTWILCLKPYYRGWVTGLLVHFHAVPRRGTSLEWVEWLTWSSCPGWHPPWVCAVGEIFVVVLYSALSQDAKLVVEVSV